MRLQIMLPCEGVVAYRADVSLFVAIQFRFYVARTGTACMRARGAVVSSVHIVVSSSCAIAVPTILAFVLVSVISVTLPLVRECGHLRR